ncbi:MAG: YbaK/EbsC family protein [Ignavibacteria bacterium]|nr:YbaK/EbsC family protein [Ignavibacteria bacterium]
MAKFDRILDYLNRNNVYYKVVSHSDAFTAHQVAMASHVPDRIVAKTLVVNADNQRWMVVLRADHRLDHRLLKQSLEVHHTHLISEEELEELFPDCEPSAMPPLGKLYNLPVIVEKSLTDDEEILFNACTHRDAIQLRYSEYERLEEPVVAEFADRHTHVRSVTPQ